MAVVAQLKTPASVSVGRNCHV